MGREEMPIFTRSYDLLVWLLEVTRHFPKANRHDFTKRLLDAGFDLRERLEEANLARGAQRLNRLNEVNGESYSWLRTVGSAKQIL